MSRCLTVYYCNLGLLVKVVLCIGLVVVMYRCILHRASCSRAISLNISFTTYHCIAKTTVKDMHHSFTPVRYSYHPIGKLFFLLGKIIFP